MIHIIKNIKVFSSVSALNIIDENIYTLDTSYGLNVFSKENFVELYKHILVQDSDERHIYDKTYAISNNKHFYTSKSNSSTGTLFLLENDYILEQACLNFHDEPLSVATFSNNSELIALGAEDGKVFFYDLNIDKSILSLKPRSDAISSISFSKDDRYSCIGAYDKLILIYDIESNKEVAEVNISDAVEDSLFLDDSVKVVGITRDKKLFLYDKSVDEKLKYADFLFNSWPTVITQIGSNHLLVGTRTDEMYLVNSETLEMIKEIKLDNIGVKKLTIDGTILYIGFIDGSIEIVDTMANYQEFEVNIKINKFDIATSFIEKNVFLLTQDIIEKYDNVWEQILDMAKSHILNNENEEALKLVKPFFFDKKKETEFNFLNANKNDIARFVELVKREKDILAFRFADEITHLKHTKEFDIIEKKWQRVYHTCKLLFEKGDLESSQKAIDTLKLYTTIPSKKKEIENLITNYKNFITAYKLVKARSFKLYFLLVSKKPFLAHEELYKKVNQIGHQTYLKLLNHEQKDELEKAMAIAEYLIVFTDFKEKAIEHIESIKLKIALKSSIEDDDIETVYTIVSNNSELENVKCFKEYHKKFLDIKHSAMLSAKDGKSEEVHTLLSKYMAIDYIRDSVTIVFKLSYLTELENAAKTTFDFVDWKETLDRYIKLYNIDNEISSFVRKYNLKAYLSDYNSTNVNIDTSGSIVVFK